MTSRGRQPNLVDIACRALLALVVAVSGAGCGMANIASNEPGHVWGTSERQAPRTLTLDGRIEAVETRLTVPWPGLVRNVNVKEGQTVTKGQVLLELEKEALDNQIRALELAIRAGQREQQEAQSWIRKLEAQLERELSLRQAALRNPRGSASKASPASAGSVHTGEMRSKHTVSGAISSPEPKDPGKATLQDSQEQLPVAGLDRKTKTIPDERLAQEREKLHKLDMERKEAVRAEIASRLGELEARYLKDSGKLQEIFERSQRALAKTKPFPNLGFLRPKADDKLKVAEEIHQAQKDTLDAHYKTARSILLSQEKSQVSAIDEVIRARTEALESAFAYKQQAERLSEAIKQSQETQKRLAEKISQSVESLQAAQSDKHLRAMLASNKVFSLTYQVREAKSLMAQAAHQLPEATAARAQLEAKAKAAVVKSPITGVCASRNINPGELAVPGQTLLRLYSPQDLYMRAFIPEGMLAQVKLGQPARIILDGRLSDAISARIVSIDHEASFTPENVYFKEDRVRQVFGINLKINDTRGMAKPGLHASAEVRINEDG